MANKQIKYKQLYDEGEPFYPMVGKSSYPQWLGYEEVDGTPPDGNFVLPIANGGTGGITEYINHESGSLTTALNKDKIFTVSGNGLVFVSVSLRTGTKTWGATQANINLNSDVVAYSSDTITGAYDGMTTGANAVAFVKVKNGDVITTHLFSTRYVSENNWFADYNVLAFGCTLSVS